MSAAEARIARRVDHVGIVVRDAQAAIDWYADSFGFVVDSDELIHGDAHNVRLVFLVPGADAAPGATALQLLAPFADGPIGRYLAEHGEGLHHVCFAVDDVAATTRALGDESTQPFVGGKGRLCSFPSGVPSDVRLELVQEEPA
ncbi:VOC family protein [Protaetiibacter larvae]|uniref:VOC domain-containing protein n=1 Tax=Protaetiibacter larvae TaxID=2592654 RepID=A0A5C1Y8K2_9MICO|nr:VOC family protein [Protaetiibacter larvae]QEO09499.1 hypothetical protein FLP23_05430 [Protaetiibacter larvae]